MDNELSVCFCFCLYFIIHIFMVEAWEDHSPVATIHVDLLVLPWPQNMFSVKSVFYYAPLDYGGHTGYE